MLALLAVILITVLILRCFPERCARVGSDGGDPTLTTRSVTKHYKMPNIKTLMGRTIIDSGLHKGKSFEEVVVNFPEYLIWCNQHKRSLGVQTLALGEYALWVAESKDR